MSLLDSKKIRALREKRGWDQYELAEIAKVNASVISRLERGLQIDFKLSVIVSVARALGVSVDELLLSESDSQSEQQFVPELEAILLDLKHQTANIQKQAAGILRGFLSTIQS